MIDDIDQTSHQYYRIYYRTASYYRNSDVDAV